MQAPSNEGEPRARLHVVRGREVRPRRRWGPGLSVSLVAVDLTAAAAAVVLAEVPVVWATTVVALVLACRAAAGVYRPRLHLSYLAELPRATTGLVAAFALLAAVVLVSHVPLDTGRPAGLAIVLCGLLAAVPRAGLLLVARLFRARWGRCVNTVIVADGTVARELAAGIVEHSEFGLRPIGVVGTVDGADLVNLGGDLEAAIRRTGASAVVADPDLPNLLDHARAADRAGAPLLVVAGPRGARPGVLGVEPLVRVYGSPASRPSWWIKSTFDRSIAGIALLAVAPILFLACLALAVEQRGRVFHRQELLGRSGRIFAVSTLGADGDGGVATFLRSTGLDELPRLWSVVRGDLGIVGPLAAAPGPGSANPLVTPGLTGLHGVDDYYVTRWSLLLEFRVALAVGRRMLRPAGR